MSHESAHFGAGHFVTEYVMTGTAEGKSFAITGTPAKPVLLMSGILGSDRNDFLGYAQASDSVVEPGAGRA